MAAVFEVDVEEIKEDCSPETIENWDSLRQMQLVVALEKEMNIEFEDEEIEKLENFQSILQILSTKVS